MSYPTETIKQKKSLMYNSEKRKKLHEDCFQRKKSKKWPITQSFQMSWQYEEEKSLETFPREGRFAGACMSACCSVYHKVCVHSGICVIFVCV